MFNWYNKEQPVTSIVSLGGGAFSSSIGGAAPNTYWVSKVYESGTARALRGDPYVDSDNNIYHASASGNQAVVFKRDINGDIVWAREITNTESVYSLALRTLVSDGTYLYAVGYLSLEGATVVIKYDFNGNIQWYKTWYSGSGDSFTTMEAVVDSSGNVYVSCAYKQPSGPRFMNVMKINSAGTLQYSRIYGNSGVNNSFYQAVSQLAIDSNDNLFISGTLDTSGSRCAVLLKINPSTGNITWEKFFSVSTNDAGLGYGVAVDSSDNVFWGIRYNNTYYILKYNNAGTLQTSKNTTLFRCHRFYIDHEDNLWGFGNSSQGYDLWDTSLNYQFGRTTNPLYQIYAYRGSAMDGIYFSKGYSGDLGWSAYLPLNGSPTGTYSVDGSNITFTASANTVSAGLLSYTSVGSGTNAGGSESTQSYGYSETSLTLTSSVTFVK